MAGGRLKSLTDGGKSPEVRECSVCLRNSEEASTAQREQGTGQQKFKVEGSSKPAHEEHHESPGRGVK